MRRPAPERAARRRRSESEPATNVDSAQGGLSVGVRASRYPSEVTRSARGRIREQRVPERLARLAVGEADDRVRVADVAGLVLADAAEGHLGHAVLLYLGDDELLALLLQRQPQLNPVAGRGRVIVRLKRDRLAGIGLAIGAREHMPVLVLEHRHGERLAL